MMLAKKNADRDRLIVERRKTGLTFAALGREFKLSRDRVRGIVVQAERETRANSPRAPFDELPVRIKNALRNASNELDFGDYSPESIAKIHAGTLLTVPGVGRGTVAHIDDWLASHGMRLSGVAMTRILTCPRCRHTFEIA